MIKADLKAEEDSDSVLSNVKVNKKHDNPLESIEEKWNTNTLKGLPKQKNLLQQGQNAFAKPAKQQDDAEIDPMNRSQISGQTPYNHMGHNIGHTHDLSYAGSMLCGEESAAQWNELIGTEPLEVLISTIPPKNESL